jgi:hypothetical protein
VSWVMWCVCCGAVIRLPQHLRENLCLIWQCGKRCRSLLRMLAHTRAPCVLSVGARAGWVTTLKDEMSRHLLRDPLDELATTVRDRLAVAGTATIALRAAAAWAGVRCRRRTTTT